MLDICHTIYAYTQSDSKHWFVKLHFMYSGTPQCNLPPIDLNLIEYIRSYSSPTILIWPLIDDGQTMSLNSNRGT